MLSDSPFARAIVMGVIGGTISELSGDKFANGVGSAVFAQLFNYGNSKLNETRTKRLAETKESVNAFIGWAKDKYPTMAFFMDINWEKAAPLGAAGMFVGTEILLDKILITGGRSILQDDLNTVAHEALHGLVMAYHGGFLAYAASEFAHGITTETLFSSSLSGASHQWIGVKSEEISAYYSATPRALQSWGKPPDISYNAFLKER